jgi:transcriptional regulator with XRE-family HTH domain
MAISFRSARDVSVELKAWRASMGYSQQQAAGHLGVDLAQYLDWEKGAACPFANMLDTAVGVPVSPHRFQQ